MFHGPVLDALAAKYVPILLRLAEFLAVAVLLYGLGRLVVLPVVRRALARAGLNRTLQDALENVATAGIVVFALAAGAAAGEFHAFLGGSALVVAALSLAVGFAAQEVLANVVAGIFLVGNPRLNVGDVIEWGETGEGVVQAIGFRTTRVRTLNNDTVIVPNTQLTVESVRNRTINDPIGITFDLGISYADDLGQAMRIVGTVAREHPELVAEPDPQVRVVELAGDDVVVRARGWLPKERRERREAVRSTFVRRSKERLQAADVAIGTITDVELAGEVGLRDAPPAE